MTHFICVDCLKASEAPVNLCVPCVRKECTATHNNGTLMLTHIPTHLCIFSCLSCTLCLSPSYMSHASHMPRSTHYSQSINTPPLFIPHCLLDSLFPMLSFTHDTNHYPIPSSHPSSVLWRLHMYVTLAGSIPSCWAIRICVWLWTVSFSLDNYLLFVLLVGLQVFSTFLSWNSWWHVIIVTVPQLLLLSLLVSLLTLLWCNCRGWWASPRQLWQLQHWHPGGNVDAAGWSWQVWVCFFSFSPLYHL